MKFIADDGKIFDNLEDCEYYEKQLKHSWFPEIKLYDEDWNILQSDNWDEFIDTYYNYCFYIKFPNYEIKNKFIQEKEDSCRYTTSLCLAFDGYHTWVDIEKIIEQKEAELNELKERIKEN